MDPARRTGRHLLTKTERLYPPWAMRTCLFLYDSAVLSTGITPLLFRCAKTVSEPDPFHPKTLLLERKQIPRIVVTIRNSRKKHRPPGTDCAPLGAGVGRSNRPAQTNRISSLGSSGRMEKGPCDVVCDVSARTTLP